MYRAEDQQQENKVNERMLDDDQAQEEVDKFVYLGATLSRIGGAEKDINRRINQEELSWN